MIDWLKSGVSASIWVGWVAYRSLAEQATKLTHIMYQIMEMYSSFSLLMLEYHRLVRSENSLVTASITLIVHVVPQSEPVN